MSLLDCVLGWLDHLKPLWDFLTAVGTIGLALVTVYLTRRKPKVHLSRSVAVTTDSERVSITATNDGEAAIVFLKFSWRAEGFRSGPIDLPIMNNCLVNGNQRVLTGATRLVRGDVISASWLTKDLADLATTFLPDDMAEAERIIRGSSFACVTTTGESFKTPLPQPVQKAITDRIRLNRTLI